MAKRSIVDRARVVALAREGKGLRQIMRLTGLSSHFGLTWMNRSDTEDMTRSGRPPKANKMVTSKIKKIMYGRRRQSLRFVAGALKKRNIAEVSYEAVPRGAHATGLKAYKRP